MDEADRIAPRVGVLMQENIDLRNQVQQLCPQHEIQHLVLCRGTDGYVRPNKSLQPWVAPFRRRICIRRHMEDFVVDPEWEQWERLTFKGLRRKRVAARVCLTMFAKLRVSNTVISTPLMGEQSSSSADANRRSAENPSLPKAKRLRRPQVAFEDSSNTDDRRHEITEPATPTPIDNTDQSDKRSREMIDLIALKHGPKFLALSKEEQAWLLQLHRNLGHPSASKLIESCHQLNCDPHVLHAAPDLKRQHVLRPSDHS